MTTRRNFLKLGAIFAPALVAQSVAYSFLWTRVDPFDVCTFAGITFPVGNHGFRLALARSIARSLIGTGTDGLILQLPKFGVRDGFRTRP